MVQEVAIGHETVRWEPTPAEESVVQVQNLSLFYGKNQALYNVSVNFPRNKITAIIGPSGCGKSTLLRSLNRMNDLVPGVRLEGKVIYEGVDIYDPQVDPVEVRRHIGMVFQKPNPFPKTIYENVVFGLRLQGQKTGLDEVVQRALQRAALWDEVKDKLGEIALRLSGGQQQRLCIARAIATEPPLLLLDEPTSALDPIATERIESLLLELKQHYSLVIVTHNMQQAARIADRTIFMHLGVLIEEGPTSLLFTNPKDKRTEAYITGRFG
ncbi:phosphate ABC transporter ATP-binding protein PstB [Meiothermus sp.]|uniref:phosphate ABC transporter ATP-binding protein PstB n=1 Tax=Meiothermus sp. TaxID=1955249 RepID=UPI0021DD0B32|nr:phosphate ABC transporter ATP-binding protein PstB [Meiothermus sp.]GIW26467.1 MAG: phosphate import ATP-binding protein PstB [Meiothermus sp.]